MMLARPLFPFPSPAIPQSKDVIDTNGFSPRIVVIDEYFNWMEAKDKWEEEEMYEQTTDVTVTAKGLEAYLNDMIGLLDKKRTVEKVAPETGRYYQVSEDIPEEELFTLVVIRPTKDGNFVVQANNRDLSKLNEQDNQNAQAQKYAKVS